MVSSKYSNSFLIVIVQVRQLVSLSSPRRGGEHDSDQFTRGAVQPLLRPRIRGRRYNNGDESRHERGERESLSVPHRQRTIEDPSRVEREPLAVPSDVSQVRRRVPHPQSTDATGDLPTPGGELQLGEAAVQLSEEPRLYAGAAAAAAAAASESTASWRPSSPSGEIRVDGHRIRLTSGTTTITTTTTTTDSTKRAVNCHQLPATIAYRARGRSSCPPEPCPDDGSTIEQRAAPTTAVRIGIGLSATIRRRFTVSQYRSNGGSSTTTTTSKYRAATEVGAIQRRQIGQRLGSWKRSLHRLLFGVRRSGSAQKT